MEHKKWKGLPWYLWLLVSPAIAILILVGELKDEPRDIEKTDDTP